MDFRLSDEQVMLGEVARKMLLEECESARLRRQMETDAPFDAPRWAKICEMGLTGVLLREEHGGLGLSEPDFLVVAQSAGLAHLPEPLVEHAGVALPLLAEASGWVELVERAASGAAILAVGHPINPLVADADVAEALLLHHDGELHLVPRDQVRLTRRVSADPFRRLFEVEWTAGAGTLLAEKDRAAPLWALALDRGALFAAAQALGAAERCVDLAVAYAKERQQFGKPIGAYQAVKHMLATVQVKIEFARPVLQAAAAEAASQDLFSRARISHAKLAAVEAADLAARTAVQVHGAMGYSWEVDVHFFVKRALALAAAWGGPDFHRRRIRERTLALPTGPDQTFRG